MLHRIKWVEHNSKRDGKSNLTSESCAGCHVFTRISGTLISLPLILN